MEQPLLQKYQRRRSNNDFNWKSLFVFTVIALAVVVVIFIVIHYNYVLVRNTSTGTSTTTTTTNVPITTTTTNVPIITTTTNAPITTTTTNVPITTTTTNVPITTTTNVPITTTTNVPITTTTNVPTITTTNVPTTTTTNAPTTSSPFTHNLYVFYDYFYLIDRTTCNATFFGPTGYYLISGMSVHPITNILYAVGNDPSSISCLITININTGAGNLIGQTGLGNGNNNCFDIAFRPSDAVLFGYCGGNANRSLYVINIDTGAATLWSNNNQVSYKGNALAFNDNSVLFTANNFNLTILNQTYNSSFSSPISSQPLTYLVSGTNARAAAMKFDEFGTLYASVIADPNTFVLGIINISNSSVSTVCTVNADAIVFMRPSTYTLYGATGSLSAVLYQINKITGSTTLIGNIGFDLVSGMDVHPITNVLYATARDPNLFLIPSLITINTTSGAGTLVGQLGLSAADNCFDITFRPSDNVLFGYCGGNGNRSLYIININTGAATLWTNNNQINLEGNALAFNSSSTLFTANNASLIILNQTFNSSFLSPISNQNLTYVMSGTRKRASAMKFDENGVLYTSIFVDSATFNFGIIHLVNLTVTVISSLPPFIDAIAFVKDYF